MWLIIVFCELEVLDSILELSEVYVRWIRITIRSLIDDHNSNDGVINIASRFWSKCSFLLHLVDMFFIN